MSPTRQKFVYTTGAMSPDQGWLGNSGWGYVNNFMPVSGGYSPGPYLKYIDYLYDDRLEGLSVYGEWLGGIVYADSSGMMLHYAVGGGLSGYRIYSHKIIPHYGNSETLFPGGEATSPASGWSDPTPANQTIQDTFGVQFCVFGNYVYATNGVDKIHRILGNSQTFLGYTAITSSTGSVDNLRARLIRSHGGHLIAANISLPTTGHGLVSAGDHPNLVWWSAFDQPMVFGSISTTPQYKGTDFKFLYDTPGGITALVPAGDVIFVFKEKAIYIGDGPPFRWNLLSSSIGTQFPNSAEFFNNGVYFMSDSGPAYVGRDGSIKLLLEGSAQRALVGTSTAFSE